MGRAAIYTRDDQDQSQAEACRAYAHVMGYRIVADLSDTGPGTDMSRMPNLHRILDIIEAGQANVLIVTGLDRIGKDTAALYITTKILEQAGCRLEALDIELAEAERKPYEPPTIERQSLTGMAAFFERFRQFKEQFSPEGEREQ